MLMALVLDKKGQCVEALLLPRDHGFMLIPSLLPWFYLVVV